MSRTKPRVAVHKLASCDGCQLTLLDCEEYLLDLVGALDIVYFMEARSQAEPGPWDISLVEGSISTPQQVEEIRHIREQSRFLVAIGACATTGGIQALRNGYRLDAFKAAVYARPEAVESLATSTPISQHVQVDLELQGCPINREQLLYAITSLLAGHVPNLPSYSVCLECKRRGNVCLLVSSAAPCLGPVVHAGCGALCPSYGRGCYGCFGPSDAPQVETLALQFEERGLPPADVVRRFRLMTAFAEPFRKGVEAYERKAHQG
ncbi:MAG: oxidoreductase [Firmicutes bacterium]|nr:oxidoreductase [Bacillota bacterium]